MAKFGDLTTAIEVRRYLLDVVERTLRSDKDAFMYHYTNFTSLFKIVTSGYIYLGSTQKMNDYIEGDFIETVDGRHRVFSACFSRAEENLAMYKMYAPNPDGAMLVFPCSLAQRMIDELPDSKEFNKLLPIVRNNKITEELTPAALQWAAVAYKDLHENTLRLNNARNDALENPLYISELAGFVKLHGWEYEKEVRLVAFVINELTEDDKVAVKLPYNFINQIKIVTGPSFDKRLHLSEIAKLKRMGVAIQNSEYDELVDLGGSLIDDAKKRIAILEEKNAAYLEKIKALEDLLTKSYEDQDRKKQLEKYKTLRDEAIYVLSYFANVYTHLVEEPDERHEEANKALRNIGIKFEVFSKADLHECQNIPKSEDLFEVSRQFIGLSNSMYFYKGEDLDRALEDVLRRRDTIKRILSI